MAGLDRSTEAGAGRFSEFALGWRVVFAAAVGTAFGASPVPFQMIGPLTKPLQQSFGWDRGQVQGALLWFTLAVVAVVPLAGTLIDRLGVRRVALTSLTLFGICLAALALVSNLYVFYVAFALMGVLGVASTPIAWTRVVNSYFVERRGLALALTLTGTGLSAFLVPRICTELISMGSWRYAPLGLALLPLVVALPLAWLWFHDRKTDPVSQAGKSMPAVETHGASLQEAVRDYRFYALALSILFIATGIGGSITNFVPMLTDKQFKPDVAANIAGTVGLSIIVGRLVTGYLIDRFWAPIVALPMLALPALACVLLMQPTLGLREATMCAALIGLCAGAESDLIAFLTAKYFGLRHYGKIYGVQYAVFGLASGVSPLLFARVFDTYGSYAPILKVSAGLFVVGSLLLLTLGRYQSVHAAKHS